MSTRRLAKSALWSLLNHLLSRGSLMLCAVLLARAFAPAEFAAYSYFQLTVFMIAAYASMGLGVSASRYFAEVGHARDDGRAPPLGMLTALALAMALGGAVLVGLVPGRWLDAGLGLPRWLLAAGVFWAAVGAVSSGAVVGIERFRAACIVSAISTAAMVAGTLYAARIGSVHAAMATLVGALALQALGECAVVARELGRSGLSQHFRFRRADGRRVVDFAAPMLAVSLLYSSGSWLLGRLILERDGGQVAFALYSIGLQWFSLALVLPAMLARVVLPRLVRQGAERATPAQARDLVRKGAAMATLAAAAMAIAGLALGPWLLDLYGGQYQASRWFIGAFMVAAVITAPANMIGNAIVVNDGQRRWLLLTIVWAGVLLAVGAGAGGIGIWTGALAQATAALVLTVLAVAVARSRELI